MCAAVMQYGGRHGLMTDRTCSLCDIWLPRRRQSSTVHRTVPQPFPNPSSHFIMALKHKVLNYYTAEPCVKLKPENTEIKLFFIWLTLSLLMPYIYGATSRARTVNVVYISTYIWQRWQLSIFISCTMYQHWMKAERFPLFDLFVNT